MGNCAFTGHRPERFVFKYDETDERCRDIKKSILTACTWYIEKGVKIFYAGGALGVDMWGAEIILWLRDTKGKDIKLICALPCKGYDEKWSKEQRQRMKKY